MSKKQRLENIASGGVAVAYSQNSAVEQAMFWKWMKSTYSKAKFMQELGISDHETRILALLRGKGAEWKTFLEYHPSLVELNKLSESAIDPIADLSSHGITGKTLIQVKTAFSNPEAVAEGLSRYPEEVKFAVNKSVYEEALRQGVPEERFVKVFSDKEIKEFGQTKLEELRSGKINIGISLDSALYQGLKGAGIGALVGGGISLAISTYRYFKGEIDGKEVAVQSGLSSLQGGIIGGFVSLTGVGAKAILISVGASTLYSLPITIAAGYGASRILDISSLFKRGNYRIGLIEAEITRNNYEQMIRVLENTSQLRSRLETIKAGQRKNEGLISLIDMIRKMVHDKE